MSATHPIVGRHRSHGREGRPVATPAWPGAQPQPVVARRLQDRALTALSKCVLFLAATHVLILVTDAAIGRSLDGFNLFTMLEAERLWPALADPSAQPWSFACVALVYLVLFASLGRGVRGATNERSRERPAMTTPVVPLVPLRAHSPSTNGHAKVAVPRDRVLVRVLAGAHARLSAGAGVLALVAGLTVHMTALASVDQLVRDFPAVPDLLHEQLPYIEFGPPGEMAYGLFMVVMTLVLFRTQRRTVPVILLMLGAFYALRGVFLFLLPIGSPPTAPPLDERFVLWPFAGHAYFPGGHTGMMTVLSLSVVSPPWRRAFLAMTFVFAFGTLLARTHYAADALGGWLAGYTIVLWGRRRFGALAGGSATKRETRRAVPTPLGSEA